MSEIQTQTVPARVARDPFSLWRQMTAELDRAFGHWPSLRWPALEPHENATAAAWFPRLDVFERGGRLITKVDLPGVKKEDVSVEVTDGHLALSGERRRETEEKRDDVLRREREYGGFYRAVPLPHGVRIEDVKATFSDGVLEVSIPLPVRPETSVRKVQIEEPKDAKG